MGHVSNTWKLFNGENRRRKMNLTVKTLLSYLFVFCSSRHLEDLSVDEKITLEWILRK